jgi:V8-like Glu-specific endopeptidase
MLAAVGVMSLTPPAYAQVAITGAPTAPAPKPADRPSDPASPAPSRSGGDSDTLLADVADSYKFAVGVVVVVVPGTGAVPIGTAWAFESNLFATNGHVVEAMEDVAKKLPDAPFYIAINQRPDKRLKVAGFRKHPQYGKTETRFDGKTAISSFDLAVIRTTEAAPAHFKLASRPQLQALRSGARIAFLGFPMESLAKGNIDTQMPIATMQSGIVTSLSDNFLGDSGFENNRLVRHNLPAVGGASGSPIFTPDGVVVAILWGGNVESRLVATKDGVAQVRQANAALVNFAERIDGLAGVPRP